MRVCWLLAVLRILRREPGMSGCKGVMKVMKTRLLPSREPMERQKS